MLDRRAFLAAIASTPAVRSAFAADWKDRYPELVLAIIPAENASGVTDRFEPFIAYLSSEIGVKVTLRIANDYAAVIEGQRSGAVHIAHYGPASFARALLTGVKTEAFAVDIREGGSKGYYSVFYVLAKSPYRTFVDLKGKNLGLVDPNSTSGANMPRFMLDREHIDPESYFGKVVYAGSHENAVLALATGTVDVAADWWNSETDSNLARMLKKGMLKNADGSAMTKDDFRIIATSPMMINSPYAYLADMPADLKASIRQAFFDAPTKDKAAFDRLSDGKNGPWAPVTNADYDQIVELIRFIDALRKKRA